jgi:hypothetical protein
MNLTFIKLKKAVLICCLGSLATSASARILRVNNNIGITAEYTSVATAITAALAGDTVYVEPSPINYTETNNFITINRKITIIGNGSFLDTHPGLQTNINDSYFLAYLTFAAGSDASTISGLRFYTLTINDGVNNIMIRRCRFGAGGGVSILGTGSNNSIVENWLQSSISRSASGTGTQIQTNLQFKNNIVTSSGITILLNDLATIENNVVISNTIALNMNGATRSFAYNNIFIGTINNQSGVADALKNNITSSNTLPAGNGNQNNVLMTNVFATYPFVSDGDAMLRTGSPAINAGLFGNGDDIGAFNDGTNRPTFVLGLIPPVIPTIYSVSGVGIINTQFMNVTISTRSNN